MSHRPQKASVRSTPSDGIEMSAAVVQHAVERALAYLTERQLPSGEFQVLASTDPTLTERCAPDPAVFPSALIAHSLSFVPAAASLRARAFEFLLEQMDGDGLWRHWTRDHPHFRELPPDLDDTCCAAAALSRGGRAVPAQRTLLLDNRDARGLFFTWIVPRLRWSGAEHRKVTLRQLRHAHLLLMFFKRTSAAVHDVDAVVNANSLFYLGEFPGRSAVVEYLLGYLRDRAETACDKWYDNPFVVWYFFARALGENTPAARTLLLQRLASAQPGNALERALAACTRLYCGVAPDDAVIGELLATQLANGAWPRAALYYGGRARLPNGTFALPHPDTPRWGSEEITTAFCIEALSRWSRVGATLGPMQA